MRLRISSAFQHCRPALLFGAENVVADDIPVGEGAVDLGTVIFPEFPRERVEILWKDAELRRSPRTVGIVGDESDWVTNHGVTLGVDLKTLEYINGAPFMLAGFGWDYGGTSQIGPEESRKRPRLQSDYPTRA